MCTYCGDFSKYRGTHLMTNCCVSRENTFPWGWLIGALEDKRMYFPVCLCFFVRVFQNTRHILKRFFPLLTDASACSRCGRYLRCKLPSTYTHTHIVPSPAFFRGVGLHVPCPCPKCSDSWLDASGLSSLRVCGSTLAFALLLCARACIVSIPHSRPPPTPLMQTALLSVIIQLSSFGP